MPPLPHHLSHTFIRNTLIRHSHKIHVLVTSFSLLLGLNGLKNTSQLHSMDIQVKKSRDNMKKMSNVIDLVKAYGPMMELKEVYKVELGLCEEGKIKRILCFETKEDHRAEEARVEGGELGEKGDMGKTRKGREMIWHERVGEWKDGRIGRKDAERMEGKAHVEEDLGGIGDIAGMGAIRENDSPGPTEWKSTKFTRNIEPSGGSENTGKVAGNQDTKGETENGSSEKSADVDDVN